jgi:hypothetical protein
MIEILEALTLGTLFGFALQKAGLTRYDRIVGVYRLRDFTVMQFMLSALVVAATLNQAFAALGLAKAPPTPPTFVLANVVGGLVFGVGMASAGYCPGTIVAEAGEGRLDAWVAGLAGMFVGAIAFGLLQPWLMPKLTRSLALGRIGLASLVGTSPWLTLLVFGELVALVLYLIARAGHATRAARSTRASAPGGSDGHAPA